MAGASKAERSLKETPTWAVAVVCFVLVLISIVIEHIIHFIGKWLKKKHMSSLHEALEKVKAELMLLGFISLLLTVGQGPISRMCIPESVADTWHPCKKMEATKSKTKDTLVFGESSIGRRLLSSVDSIGSIRRSLAGAAASECKEGEVALVSSYAIHQLHIFIFVLAIFHILYCIATYSLSRAKMRRWEAWENETRTTEYQFSHDPERFRFARDTTFGRRHFNIWSKSPILLWIACFFRQFTGSVEKVDYLTLRHGFIMAHLAPQSETKFDFRKYIKRSLDEDFKVVVGISPLIWFFAVLFLLFNTHGWYSYLWLPFIPLIIILLVSTKLQVIITMMGLRIQDRGNVVRGDLTVEPADDLFWFDRPQLILSLIHFVLFQMGSSMRPTVFNERVAAALKRWHHTARKHIKENRHSKDVTPNSSMPSTPMHGFSPVHLLSNHQARHDFVSASPRSTIWDSEHWENEESPSPPQRASTELQEQTQEMELAKISLPISQIDHAQNEIDDIGPTDQYRINIGSSSNKEFSFQKRLRE
ncbi:hypothetical protein Scep_015643 [Stephania cephalantha]|uniref:MLO-like protein n=1 Tax=Stephania cephalantha TaxID=152367 RepID=A0AAP0J5R8_9MAGN